MKIAFLCIYSHPSICGVWNRVSSMAEMLIKKGHEVHVFSTNIIKGTNKKSKSYEVYNKIKIHRFSPKLSFGENVKFWDFVSELEELNPDIIITEVYRHPHTNLALKVAQKLKKPIFLVTHAPFVETELRSRFDNLIVNFYDKFYGRKTINKFNKVITITKWEIPYLLKLGVQKNKLFYLPNGIPKQFFEIKQKKGKEILFLGRISPIKNLETLIISIKKSTEKYPNIKLKIIGPAEESYKKKLVGLIKKLKLEKNITFYPAVYDLNKKIKIIDDSEIFVLPSKREAMPQSLIEAMARGKIVIASDNKGSSEIIKDKENGFLFPISNPEKLARTIDFILNRKNEKILSKIRKNARKKALEFRWDILINKMEALF